MFPVTKIDTKHAKNGNPYDGMGAMRDMMES